ncbi:MAG: hypothetical protein IJO14_08430 [Clostridia bacterium]|nr:hypothetical protein [Clostridia bacterium]
MKNISKAVFCVAFCLLLFLNAGCVTLRFDDGIIRNFQQQPVQPQQSQSTLQPQMQQQPQQQQPQAQQSAPATPTHSPAGNAAANWSQEQILSYFTAALNAAKSADAAYSVDCAISHDVEIFSISSEPMREKAEEIVTRLKHSRAGVFTVSGGNAVSNGETLAVKDLIVPTGSTLSMDVSAIESARASFDGENIIIVMKLKDDTANHQNPVPVQTKGLIPYISLHGYKTDPYTINKAEINYTSCTVAAGIDAQGRLVTVTSSADVAAEATGGLGSMTADVTLMGKTKAAYTFTYTQE